MEGRQFNRRTLAILVVLTALLLLFFGVLYNLQVLHVDDYRAQSVVKIANRKTVEAARGELLDRYGRSMVTNRATYQLTLNTGVMGEEAVRNANLLELLNICRDNGLTWTDTLAVSTAAPFTYTSDTPLAYEKEGGGVALTRLGRLLNALPMKKELKSSLNLPHHFPGHDGLAQTHLVGKQNTILSPTEDLHDAVCGGLLKIFWFHLRRLLAACSNWA